ncbi:MAG TPA: hypothetical protein VF147_01605 [Vicinamibacterales bacterium]
MSTHSLRRSLAALATTFFIAATVPPSTLAQQRQEPGRSIGKISTEGNLIVMELDEGALGTANMFDLEGRTLRFTPETGGYRGENVPLKWDAEFGSEMTTATAKVEGFAFPFSGQRWSEFTVGPTGFISFGPERLAIGRFDQLQNAAPALVNGVPAISVFMKPRMSGARYVKQLPDRVVVSWSLTEPAGGIQDFTWVPTVNRFQAVLYKDGAIELSYDKLAAKDAIVGIYPAVRGGATRAIATIADADDPSIPAHLDLKSVKLAAVDGLFLDVTFTTRGAVVAEGDQGSEGISYKLMIQPATTGAKPVEWTIRGVRAGGRGGGGIRYATSGPGVTPGTKVSGSTIAIRGTLPAGIKAGDKVTVSAEATREGATGAALDRVDARPATLAGIQNPRADLSSLGKKDGPFPVVYEPFHYLSLPNFRDLTCTVIQALGDKFDFLAYYSDFRIDNQEAGTPSNGPLGGGPDGGEVTGIGARQRGLESFCTKGRFQWQFIQPVYVGSNQMQMYPPESALADKSTRNIGSYIPLLSRRAGGKMRPYNYGMSQLGHELGHRWSAFVSAKVGAETITLGPTHWARGLQAPAAFPYQRTMEASAMGGGVWQDNFDGTFTQLDDDYYVPPTGWSYLELYLMGLAAPSEVPDFFILRNLEPAGRDANGRPIFKADRTKITVNDVIAAEGPRLPDADHSQKAFNTGIVVVVEHGKKPSKELLERANGIREEWPNYWSITTGHRSTMTTNVR